MQTQAILLCAFYVVAKAYVRYWLYRPIHARPAITRHNEVLRLIDLGAITSLIAAFFFLIHAKNNFGLACAVAGGLLILDAMLRFSFLELEARRLRSSSGKWNRRGALKHVRRRAKSPMFN